MNKVYKVIWSSAKGCYIVVSELAHQGRNKAKSLKAVCALTALLCAGSLWLGQLEAQAAELNQGSDNTVVDSENTLIYGNKNKLDDSDNTIVVGNDNEIVGSFFGDEYNTILGNKIILGEHKDGHIYKTVQTVAIGSNITAPTGGTGMILIGDDVNVAAAGNNSVTIGHQVSGSTEAVVIGAVSSGDAGSIAIGNKVTSGDNAVGLGNTAQALKTQSIAIGFNSVVKGAESVAIGADTMVGDNSACGVAIGENANIGDNSDYAIAIGGFSNDEDAAKVGSNSSGSMAMGAWSKVGDNSEYSIALGVMSKINDNVEGSVALGEFAEIKQGVTGSAAIGYVAEIGENVKYGNAFGSWASVSSSYGTAVGTSSSVAAGSGRSVAVGSFSKVLDDDLFTADELAAWKQAHTEYAKFDIQKADSEYGVFSIGSADKERRIINVANGRISADSTDAINGSQLFGAMEYLNGRIDNIEQSGGSGGNTTVHPDDDNVVVKPTPENPQPGKDVDYGLSLNKDKIDLGNVTIEGNKGDITAEEYKVGDKTYISESGLNANDQKITNVADGEISADSKDAVNGSQLYATNQKIDNITQDIDNVNNRVDKLDGKINKVGAGAAALAALHPLDFDPDDKLTFAAGVGHYEGETAAALGAFYRPDEKVMFSLGGTVGNGDEMINAGISFALDRTSNVNNSKVAMAKEIIDLKAQVAQLTTLVNQMAALNGMTSKQVDMFPDVPENHWAYAYLDKLVQADIIEGYPDGNFKGDRTMTRYEFATMLCRALEKGIVLDQRVAGEFAEELNRIRIDRISGEDNEADKVERVRVVKDEERDNYGSKIK